MKVKEGRGYIYTASIFAVFSIILLVFVLMEVTTGYAAITEADCRSCHGNDTANADRHHFLYNQPIPDDSVRPYPEGDANGNYNCASCHLQVWDNETGQYITDIIRDCLQCHSQGTIKNAKITDGRITIKGSGLGLVADSNEVYVLYAESPGSCPTEVISWTDNSIIADSWRYPDGTSCAQPGDTVVVPCAAAEQILSGGSGGDSGGKPPKPCNGKKCQ